MLLLFDIDGTLLQKASLEHARALRAALHAVHGINPDHRLTEPGNAAGRTDGEIARIILLDAGVSAERIDERADDVRDATCRLYAELCPVDLSDRLVPGMSALLEGLAEGDDVRLALVTGNFEPVARIKLKHAGIGHFFPAGNGGFGSDSEDRAMLPPIARRRAGHDGVPYPREQTIVIGDTPRDIACARADGVRVVAVATGPHPAAELSAADAVARDTAELRSSLESLLAVNQPSP
jgi:phosphoglycolate phosphatase